MPEELLARNFAARYRGRFAPTPSGPLHFGSLVAAVGSYLEAQRHEGEWLVRMEDLDPPRTVPGAADGILRTLEEYGFEWDGPVLHQSTRTAAYRDAFTSLRVAGSVYPCACSRAMQEGAGCARDCRWGFREGEMIRSWRLSGPSERVCWTDRLRGAQCDNLAGEDFVVLRGDGVYAYQLAVAADDAEQGITDVVRGADLIDSTARQIWIQRLLGWNTPGYLHLPLARNEAGEKLSKQTRAPALPAVGRAGELAAALRFLGHEPPLDGDSIRDVWRWARANWKPERIPL